MQILYLTSILISLILLGIIIGIYLNSRISDMHAHVEDVRAEARIQVAILDTKLTELERGLNETRQDNKAVQEREETTDTKNRGGKHNSRSRGLNPRTKRAKCTE